MGMMKELLMEFCGAIFPDDWDEQEAFQELVMIESDANDPYEGEPNRDSFLRACHEMTVHVLADGLFDEVCTEYESYDACRRFLKERCLVVPNTSYETMQQIVEDFHKNKTPQEAPPLTLRRVARALNLIRE